MGRPWSLDIGALFYFQDEQPSLVISNDILAECPSPPTWVFKKDCGYHADHIKQPALEGWWFKLVWNEKLAVTWNPSLLTLWHDIAITSSQLSFFFFFLVGRKAHWWKLAQFFLFKLSGWTTMKSYSPFLVFLICGPWWWALLMKVWFCFIFLIPILPEAEKTEVIAHRKFIPLGAGQYIRQC